MKITKFILAAALLGGMTAGLTSCSDDDAPIVYYPVSLNITLPEEITDAEILSEEYTFVNVSTNQVKTFTNKSDIELVPGLYNITYTAQVRLSNGAKTAALSELRAVMGLDMNCGNRITVTVEGKDEEAAVAAIQNYFVDHM